MARAKIERRILPGEIARFEESLPAEDSGEDDEDDMDQCDDVFAAFWLDPMTAAELAIPGGEPPEELHVTLVFAEDGMLMGEVVLANALVNVMQECKYTGTFAGRVSGYGRFLASEGSDGKDVFVALVDIVDLEDFAEDIEDAMERAGLPISAEHGFIPHITLAYLDPGAPSPVPTAVDCDLTFNEVVWKCGDRMSVLALSEPGSGWEMYSENGVADLATVCSADHRQFRLFVESPTPARRFTLTDGALPDGGWVQVLPKPSVYTHPLWGDLVITPERNKEFVANFNNAVYQTVIPVDAEHETKLGGAFGYVKEMRVAADGSADARIELTQRGVTIMGRDGFKYVSPEWFEEWVQPETSSVFHNVLIGVAFTNNPFFKEKYGSLKPILAASEQLFWADVPERGADAATRTFHQLPARAGARTMADAAKSTSIANVGPMSATEIAAFREYQKNAPDMLKRLTESEAAVKSFSESNEVLRKENAVRKFRETAKGWVGDIDSHVQTLVDLSTAFGEESEQVKRHETNARAMTEQARAGGLFSEKGGDGIPVESGADAVAEALRQAGEIVKESQGATTQGNALAQVFSADPSLYDRYTKQTATRAGK